MKIVATMVAMKVAAAVMRDEYRHTDVAMLLVVVQLMLEAAVAAGFDTLLWVVV